MMIIQSLHPTAAALLFFEVTSHQRPPRVSGSFAIPEVQMGDDSLPDLSPTALSRLVAGMTTDDVEAVVGHFHRPNLHEGHPYFAWIGEGAMLRAFFKGAGGTLSAAILDVPDEQRVLDLGTDPSRRLQRSTIMQTWYCIPGRQRRRQPQSGRLVVCAACNGACEQVVSGIRVPSPKHTKAWDKFWGQYRTGNNGTS
jgi:hypothetical protein